MTKRYKVIGLMSGTSLDGVDAAILETDGEQIFEYGKTYFRAFTQEEKNILSNVTQAALKWNFTGPCPNEFALAENVIHKAHIEAVQALAEKDLAEVDLIGFHGQTVLHRAPSGGNNGQTLQLGEGQVLADALGVDVAYDFRANDMKFGGQGAPLAPVYHEALLQHSGASLSTGVLNVGGVSNITISTKKKVLLASDCGPGNGPLDTWVQQCRLGDYDKGGLLAMEGIPDFALVDTWLRRAFFMRTAPKSADRWDFDVLSDLKKSSPKNGAASLTLFTALAIEKAITQYGVNLDKLIVCGGGRHNEYLLWLLKTHINATIVTAEQVGWNGDDLEAQAFAYLAVRSIKNLPLSFPGTTGVSKPMCGGKLAKPNLQTQ